MTTAVTEAIPTLADVEALYAGELGDAYTARHESVPRGRRILWDWLVRRVTPASVLEVGCNIGGNLELFAGLGVRALTGLDVNAAALARLPYGIKGVQGSAAAIPLPDNYADLVFTCGVLIHIPSAALPVVFDELVRVSKRYVAIVEYEDAYERMIPWRGHDHILWSRPHTYLLWQRHPELVPIDRGLVGKSDGFDRGMGWCLWEKPGAR